MRSGFLHGEWTNVKAASAAQPLVYTQVHNEKFAKGNLKLIVSTNQEYSFQTLPLIHKLERNRFSAAICYSHGHLYDFSKSPHSEKYSMVENKPNSNKCHVTSLCIPYNKPIN